MRFSLTNNILSLVLLLDPLNESERWKKHTINLRNSSRVTQDAKITEGTKLGKERESDIKLNITSRIARYMVKECRPNSSNAKEKSDLKLTREKGKGHNHAI